MGEVLGAVDSAGVAEGDQRGARRGSAGEGRCRPAWPCPAARWHFSPLLSASGPGLASQLICPIFISDPL